MSTSDEHIFKKKKKLNNRLDAKLDLILQITLKILPVLILNKIIRTWHLKTIRIVIII